MLGSGHDSVVTAKVKLAQGLLEQVRKRQFISYCDRHRRQHTLNQMLVRPGESRAQLVTVKITWNIPVANRCIGFL